MKGNSITSIADILSRNRMTVVKELAKHVKARIYWVPVEQVGRKSIPLSSYSTAAFFKQLPTGEGWSLNLIAETEIDLNRSAVYDISFLFGETAPEHLLYSGNKFELFEGKKIADGIIL